MLTPQTVELFKQLLFAYQLPANHPNFEEVARKVSQAKYEIEAYEKADALKPVIDNLADQADRMTPGDNEEV